MSDSGIEKALEEDLQAAAPVLCLFVNGTLKETVPDTPSGRVRIDKAALMFDETDDVVVRKGAGSKTSAGSGPASVPSSSRMQGVDPASLRSPTGACCTPKPAAGPSGVRLRHAWGCPRAKGQVFHSPIVDLSRARLARNHMIETRHYGIDDAMAAHPAKGTLTAEGHWHVYPTADPLECPYCAEDGD